MSIKQVLSLAVLLAGVAAYAGFSHAEEQSAAQTSGRTGTRDQPLQGLACRSQVSASMP